MKSLIVAVSEDWPMHIQVEGHFRKMYFLPLRKGLCINFDKECTKTVNAHRTGRISRNTLEGMFSKNTY